MTTKGLHRELVDAAAKWLSKTDKCKIVVCEIVTACPEQPDVIGWRCGRSVLIECKASRSDFLSDSDKYFRLHPEMGVGSNRYYAAPVGMIKPSELPTNWGLLEYDGRRVRRTVWPTAQQANHANENLILYSLIMRGAASVRCALLDLWTSGTGARLPRCYIRRVKGRTRGRLSRRNAKGEPRDSAATIPAGD